MSQLQDLILSSTLMCLTGGNNHLRSTGGQWHVWRWLRLRGAGFPADHVRRLSAPLSCEAIDALIAAERAVSTCYVHSCELLEAKVGNADGEDRRALIGVLRKLRKGKMPAASTLFDAGQLLLATQIRAECERRVSEVFLEDERRCSEAIRALVGDPKFREAVAWQNLSAFQTAFGRLESAEGMGRKKHRRAEQMVASYLQRYCVKNDTIGFFGPQGSGEIVEGDAWKGQPGSQALKKRRVYFEHWAVSELADAISQDDSLRVHLAPRLAASLRLQDGVLHHGYGEVSTLPQDIATIVSCCDGIRTAKEIAQQLVASGDSSFEDDDDVYEYLDELHDKRILSWGIKLPTALNEPEKHLEQVLRRLPKEVTQRAQESLSALLRARDGVAQAAGDANQLVNALARLNETFETLTEQKSTRAAGAMYAGRTLVYEECLRDYELEIGADVFQRVAQPLDLLLQSARWFTAEVSKRFQGAWERDFDAICAETGESSVDYLQLFGAIRSHFGTGTETSTIVSGVKAELQARWGALLELEYHSDRIERDSAAIAKGVYQAFAAKSPGWPSARYHSPDLMVVSLPKSEEFGLFVLGEVHAAVNTCGVRVYQSQVEHAAEMSVAREVDLGQPTVVPVISRANATRADHVWMTPQGVDLEVGDTPSWREPSRVMAIGNLLVKKINGELVVCDRKSAYAFSLVEVLETALSAEVAADFSFLPTHPHRPRIQIGDLIIGRETWVFRPDELAFAVMQRGANQFIAARKWARDSKLPDRVFVKTPEETKPVFIDLQSPIYIELLARLCRQASKLTVSEMLPDLEDLWLTDGDGERYTAELRLVAVDPIQWKRNS